VILPRLVFPARYNKNEKIIFLSGYSGLRNKPGWEVKSTLAIVAFTQSMPKCILSSSLANAMEQRTLRNVNNCLNTNIYSYLETSGDQSSNLYIKVVHFFNTSVN
jgi:hypothetical protein